MRIYFTGAAAVVLPALGLLLSPGVNDVPDDVGATLLGVGGQYRKPTDQENRAHDDKHSPVHAPSEARSGAVIPMPAHTPSIAPAAPAPAVPAITPASSPAKPEPPHEWEKE